MQVLLFHDLGLKTPFHAPKIGILGDLTPQNGSSLITTPKRRLCGNTSYDVRIYRSLQEGQHPLTGQRAANFRLLANQWAERRLMTQWRHGCRAMRRSVCNAGATNAGRSFAFRYQGNGATPWQYIDTTRKAIDLRYNFAAESFYIMKLCSRLFVLYCRNCPKDDRFR